MRGVPGPDLAKNSHLQCLKRSVLRMGEHGLAADPLLWQPDHLDSDEVMVRFGRTDKPRQGSL